MNATLLKPGSAFVMPETREADDQLEFFQTDSEALQEPQIEFDLSLARSLEQRIPPQHWGINE